MGAVQGGGGERRAGAPAAAWTSSHASQPQSVLVARKPSSRRSQLLGLGHGVLGPRRGNQQQGQAGQQEGLGASHGSQQRQEGRERLRKERASAAESPVGRS